MKKRLFSLFLAVLTIVLITVSFSSCGTKEPKSLGFEVTHYATIEIRDYGTIELELYGKEAPITVENFVNLANEGLYEGLTFHRIMTDFMIQGGGYDVSGNEMDVPSIKGEFSSNGVNNPINHVRGVISMARTDVKDSASSQFFIMHKDSPHLNGDYAAFGIVTKGIAVVDKICKEVPQGYNGSVLLANRPVIEKITIREA